MGGGGTHWSKDSRFTTAITWSRSTSNWGGGGAMRKPDLPQHAFRRVGIKVLKGGEQLDKAGVIHDIFSSERVSGLKE